MRRPCISWPHAAQVLRIRRDSGLTRGPWTHKEIAYGTTSLPEDMASPRHLAVYARNHGGIENREHYVRDKTFGGSPAGPHREPAERPRRHPQRGHRRLPPRWVRHIAHARRYYGRGDARILALYGYN